MLRERQSQCVVLYLVRPYSFQELGVDKTKKKKACDSIRRSKFKFRSSHINGPLKLFSLSLVVNFLYGDIMFFAPKILNKRQGKITVPTCVQNTRFELPCN